MPRSIIDTESSRPAYRRRLLVRWIVIAVLMLAALAVGVWLWQASRPTMVNLAPVPHDRREYAA
jgi:cytoskeletal protein RodZ